MHPTSRAIETVRSSYWFLPSIMAVTAGALGALMVWVDVRVGSDWLDGIGWYQSAKADGAQEVLSTIAGSMITVAGVVFSITIVAIAYASSQYGPRVLTNFMGDRGNQVTLGTFIATFVYCLVVLRTIRGGDEDSFVPQLAVLAGLALALCSIAVLIYFIHHVTESIHINHVAARIGRQLIDGVGQRFPAFIGDPAEPDDTVKDPSRDAVAALSGGGGEVAAVAGRVTGYVQAIDEGALLEAAREADVVVRLRFRPGDFLHAGRTLLDAWPANRLSEGTAARLRGSYTVGHKRTPAADLDFLIGELAEIGTRALSTGVNDPATARTCLDWLGAGATEIAQRRIPSPLRVDKEGRVRAIALPDGFAGYIERSFGALRQHAAREASAALHLLRTLGEVAASCRTREQVDALRTEAERLVELAGKELDGAGLESVRRRGAELAAMLDASPGNIDARQLDWLGGSG